MLKTFTFVKMQAGFSHDEFFERGCRYAQNFEIQCRTEIKHNRLMLIEGEGPYVGIEEMHWENAAALDRTLLWYETPIGQIYRQELETLMDTVNSLTFLVTHEAAISRSGEIETIEADPAE